MPNRPLFWFVAGALCPALLLLASCPAGPNVAKLATEEQDGGRFKITRVQLFADSVAYHGQRAVYTILDTETGKEYVGVSGVGISETGQHGGKSRRSDER